LRSSRKKASKKTAQAAVRTKLSGVDRAKRFVSDVLAGRVVACKYVKQACRRHRDDLRASRRKEYRWHYDETRAERFIRFHEACPHVKDDFKGHAKHHERFVLEDHQCFEFCSIYGWVDKKEGFRRFNDVYIEKPRKNGKTPNAAVVGLYGLCADGEYGAEVFAGASSKEQAGELGSVFDTARNMALASPELRAAFGLWVNANSLVVAKTNSSFKKLKGQPMDGPAPHVVIADEYHEYKTNRLIEWAKTGMTSRRQPLLFRITTAGTNTASPCYEMHLEVKEVLEGRRKNDRLFCIIYTIDKGVDWKSKKALRMANPNFGVSVNPNTLEEDQFQARQSATKQAAFKTKNLNIWMNASQPWINMDHWDACHDVEMRIEDFRLEPCIEIVDLASRKDTVSTARMFKRILPTGKDGAEQQHYYAFVRVYLNSEQVRDEKHPHFADWADQGMLIETEGNITDYLKVCDDLAADADDLVLRELVFDPYHAAPLVQFLTARPDWPYGIDIVDLKQTEENMSAPMKEFEAAIDERRFHHDGNLALAWMVGNTRARRSLKENWYPVRENVERKIDGTITLILGTNRLMQLELETNTRTEVRWIEM
jgi:phage terminase large subunit-like protein